MSFRDYIKVDVNNILPGLESAFKRILAKAAGEIRDELTQEAQSAIANFYGSYSPKYYNRNYEFFSNSFQKYYHNSGNIIYGGVRLTPGNLSGAYFNYHGRVRVSNDEVFATVFSGQHGPAMGFNNPPAVTSPSPTTMLLDKQQEIVANGQKYLDLAGTKIIIKIVS